jgi:hypothetical protein
VKVRVREVLYILGVRRSGTGRSTEMLGWNFGEGRRGQARAGESFGSHPLANSECENLQRGGKHPLRLSISLLPVLEICSWHRGCWHSQGARFPGLAVYVGVPAGRISPAPPAKPLWCSWGSVGSRQFPPGSWAGDAHKRSPVRLPPAANENLRGTHDALVFVAGYRPSTGEGG